VKIILRGFAAIHKPGDKNNHALALGPDYIQEIGKGHNDE